MKDMEKLKLEYLAPYLPYRLKVYITEWKCEREIYQLSQNSLITKSFGNKLDFEHIKPILRPIQGVEQYFDNLYGCLGHQDVTDFLDVDFLNSHNNIEIEEIQLLEIEELPFGTLKVLLKHHFDVFGLIEKGLAIPVTNELNPY